MREAEMLGWREEKGQVGKESSCKREEMLVLSVLERVSAFVVGQLSPVGRSLQNQENTGLQLLNQSCGRTQRVVGTTVLES